MPKDSTPFYKRYRFLIFLFLILFFLFSGAYSTWLFLQKPAIGEVRVAKEAPAEDRDSSKKPKQYEGKYLTFSYPGIYAEKARETPVNGPVKESIFLSAADFEGRKIAIIVEQREESNFEVSPSFQMRLLHPKTYARTSIGWEDLDGVLFTKNSQVFEQTAFFQKKNFILSISTTSPLRIDTLREDLENILRNLEWKIQ